MLYTVQKTYRGCTYFVLSVPLYGAHSLRGLHGFALITVIITRRMDRLALSQSKAEQWRTTLYRYNSRALYHDLEREVPFPVMNIDGIKVSALLMHVVDRRIKAIDLFDPHKKPREDKYMHKIQDINT